MVKGKGEGEKADARGKKKKRKKGPHLTTHGDIPEGPNSYTFQEQEKE